MTKVYFRFSYFRRTRFNVFIDEKINHTATGNFIGGNRH